MEEGSGARGTRRCNDGGGGPEEEQHWNPMGKRKNGGRARRRLRVWLDVDTGIDDAHALMLALRSPELDVVGVSCVAGNNDVDTVTVATLKVMDACFGPPSEEIGCSGKNSLPQGAGHIDKPFDDDDRGCSSSSSDDDDDDNGGSGESSLKEGGGRARSSIGRPRRRRPRTTAPLVAKGCAAPLLECCRPCPQIHGKDSLGDLTPPPMPAEPARRAHPADAVTLLVEALERCGRKRGQRGGAATTTIGVRTTGRRTRAALSRSSRSRR